MKTHVIIDANRKASDNFRQERIEKLLHELRYEIERGMMSREIDEEMGFQFYVPVSNKLPDGVVFCEFRTRPVPRHHMSDKGGVP